MKRFLFLTSDLKDLQQVEGEFQQSGIERPQFHVVSNNEAELERYHLNNYFSLFKSNILHSLKNGAIVGLILSVALLVCAYLFSWEQQATGWLPFVMLAVITVGFCTWEGGLIGAQQQNPLVSRYQDHLSHGKHLLMADVSIDQQSAMNAVVKRHPQLTPVGIFNGSPDWFVHGQIKVSKWFKTMP